MDVFLDDVRSSRCLELRGKLNNELTTSLRTSIPNTFRVKLRFILPVIHPFIQPTLRQTHDNRLDIVIKAFWTERRLPARRDVCRWCLHVPSPAPDSENTPLEDNWHSYAPYKIKPTRTVHYFRGWHVCFLIKPMFNYGVRNLSTQRQLLKSWSRNVNDKRHSSTIKTRWNRFTALVPCPTGLQEPR